MDAAAETAIGAAHAGPSAKAVWGPEYDESPENRLTCDSR